MKKLILSGDIGWEIRVWEIRNFLDEANGADIEVHLASPGGYIFDGIEIYNLFRDYKRNNSNAQMMLIIKGEAASMASYIAVNPAWDLVAAEDNAVLMIHNAWGGVVGDYREVAKMAEILDGLTNLIGKAYSKKLKKSLSEIRELMDEESWYFGDEILKAGFVDEIIKTDKVKNRNDAIDEVKNKFQVMQNKSPKNMPDIQKIAAMVKPEILKDNNASNTPAVRDNNIQEEISMTLEEFLAQNPSAQIELNKIKDKTFEAGAKSVQERIKGAMPYLSPESAYPGPIKALALKVVDGEVDMSSLSASVATYDSLKEKDNSAAAAEEAAKLAAVTGQQVPQLSTDGKINNELDFQAVVNGHKVQAGMEVN